MKKLVALMLALMLALSGTLALAEQAAQPTPMTITSRLEINRDAVGEIMTANKLPEETIALTDTILGIINTATESLVIANGGFEYVLNLNDNTLLSLAGEADDKGIAAVCSLVPSFTFTMSAESIVNMLMSAVNAAQAEEEKQQKALESVDTAALTEAVTGYITEYIDSFVAAITTGDAQTGSFVVDEGEFNCMVPMNVDLVAIVNATNTLVDKINSDANVAAALQAMNATVSETQPIPTEDLPDVVATVYMNVDDNGEVEDGTYLVCSIAPKDVEAPFAVYKQYTDSEGMWCTLEAPDAGCNLAYDQKVQADGFTMKAEAVINEVYFGADMAVVVGDETVATTKLYYINNETPIATDITTISPTGERTVTVRGENKTEVAVEDLIEGKDESLSSQIGVDFLFNGLGGVMNALTESTPEAGQLIGMLMGGGEQVESEEMQDQ